MKNLDLPPKLRRDVNEFFMNTQSTQDQQEELDGLLKNIQPSLRLSASKHIFANVIKKNEAIKSLLGGSEDEAVTNYCVRRLEVELEVPEHVFVLQEEHPVEENTFMYFIAKGLCQVKVRDI